MLFRSGMSAPFARSSDRPLFFVRVNRVLVRLRARERMEPKGCPYSRGLAVSLTERPCSQHGVPRSGRERSEAIVGHLGSARAVRGARDAVVCRIERVLYLFDRPNGIGVGVSGSGFRARRTSMRRAFGGCLGTRRRRRTWHAAKSHGEPRAGFDPWISEWGNPPARVPTHESIVRRSEEHTSELQSH